MIFWSLHATLPKKICIRWDKNTFFYSTGKDIKIKTMQKHEVCWAAGEHKKHKRALSPKGAVLPTQ